MCELRMRLILPDIFARFNSLKRDSRMESGPDEKAGRVENAEGCTITGFTLRSPLGPIRVSGCERGVHQIRMPAEGVVPANGDGHARVEPDGLDKMAAPVRETADWLLSYFDDPRATDKLPLPPFHHPLLQEVSFTGRVLKTLVAEVKVGQTVSYKRLAELAGNAKAARAVGGAMRRNPVPLLIPCHRVIDSSGESGRYMGGRGNRLKERLLAHEKR